MYKLPSPKEEKEVCLSVWMMMMVFAL